MRIHIQNDGGPGYRTQLTDVETGQTIEHTTDAEVHLKINVRDVPKAIITTIMPVVDVIVDAEIRQVCPCCGVPTGHNPVLSPPEALSALHSIIEVIEEYKRALDAKRIEEEHAEEKADSQACMAMPTANQTMTNL